MLETTLVSKVKSYNIELIALQNQIKASKEREIRMQNLISKINDKSASMLSLYPFVQYLKQCEEKLQAFEQSPFGKLAKNFPIVLKLLFPLKKIYSELITEFEDAKYYFWKNSSGIFEGSSDSYLKKLSIALSQKSKYINMLQKAIIKEKQLRKKLLSKLKSTKLIAPKNHLTIAQFNDLKSIQEKAAKRNINYEELDELISLYEKTLEENQQKLIELNNEEIRLARLEKLITNYKICRSKYLSLKISSASKHSNFARIINNLKRAKQNLCENGVTKPEQFEQIERQYIKTIAAAKNISEKIEILKVELERARNVKLGLTKGNEKVI